jgi:hypothetical protein
MGLKAQSKYLIHHQIDFSLSEIARILQNASL